MYYVSMYVTPHWKQSNCQKVKRALAQFWVDENDSVKAATKAINYLKKLQWWVHSLKQNTTLIGYEDHTHGVIGLTHSYRAHEQGISMCLTDWDI